MPKRRQSRRRKSSVPRPPPLGEVCISGQVLLNPTLAVGSNVTPLTPNGLNSTQLGSLSDTFQQYRFERLNVQAYPGQSDTYNIAYYNELSDVPTTTLLTNNYIPHSTLITDGTFMPRSFRVNKNFLVAQNALQWYRTRTGATTDTWEETQGTLNIVTAAISTVFVMIKYVVKFCNAMGTGMTPMLRERPSIVPKAWEKYPVIDLYDPSSPHPYPPSRSLTDDWARVAANALRDSPVIDAKFLESLASVDPRVRSARDERIKARAVLTLPPIPSPSSP